MNKFEIFVFEKGFMGRPENRKVFFEFFEQSKKDIDRLKKEHYRRILLLSLLDTLSKCAYPNEKKNRERFVHLIDEHSDWEYKDYVSLPQLSHLLLKVDGCDDLKTKVETKISEWQHDAILRPEEADLQLNELDWFRCEIWNKQIEKARYPSLLWQMRCIAVHEFRNPGQAFQVSDNNSTPYYIGLIDEKGSFQSWELYIPCQVISNIVQKCADNLKTKFENKNLDPYADEYFKFGSNWY